MSGFCATYRRLIFAACAVLSVSKASNAGAVDLRFSFTSPSIIFSNVVVNATLLGSDSKFTEYRANSVSGAVTYTTTIPQGGGTAGATGTINLSSAFIIDSGTLTRTFYVINSTGTLNFVRMIWREPVRGNFNEVQLISENNRVLVFDGASNSLAIENNPAILVSPVPLPVSGWLSFIMVTIALIIFSVRGNILRTRPTCVASRRPNVDA